MTPRAPKDPLQRTPPPLLPPAARSREALGLAVAAARGRFALQVCACGTVQYPPRAVCGACLSPALAWREVPAGGRLLAATTVRATAEPYFREHAPCRSGLVQLDCGPQAVAHLHEAVATGTRVRMTLRLDKAGQGVLFAMPEQEVAAMQEDRRLREFICDPAGRRVLVTDGRNAFGQAIARALAGAGAEVLVGVAEAWKPFGGQDRLAGTPVPLDASDEVSVRLAAAEFGGRVDILVDSALDLRPGDSATLARAAMEAACFGKLRLARCFAPALLARGGDGTHAACAWVNLVSVLALAAPPGWAAAAAAQAAALSLACGLRGRLRPGGIRVLNLLAGPLDDDWHRELPPPKVSPEALAAGVLRGLHAGLEEVAVGEIAQDVLVRWRQDPDLLQRETAQAS